MKKVFCIRWHNNYEKSTNTYPSLHDAKLPKTAGVEMLLYISKTSYWSSPASGKTDNDGKLLQRRVPPNFWLVFKLLSQGRGHSVEDVLEPSERGGQSADEQAAGRDARGEHTVIIKHRKKAQKVISKGPGSKWVITWWAPAWWSPVSSTSSASQPWSKLASTNADPPSSTEVGGFKSQSEQIQILVSIKIQMLGSLFNPCLSILIW